jgi:hypothetical protein
MAYRGSALQRGAPPDHVIGLGEAAYTNQANYYLETMPKGTQQPMRILRRQYYLQPHTTMLSQLQMQVAASNRILDEHGWTGRRVMGFKLPEWQRKPAWDAEQATRFIESIWLGVGLGTYMVNMCLASKEVDLVLLDGQQRMLAIESYLNGEFPVVGEDGNPYLWTELTAEEHAHFLRIPFPWNESAYKKDPDLRAAYNRHNFGGTAHQPDEKA